MGGCAHGNAPEGFGSSEPPARIVAELAALDGPVACAAERVEIERSFMVLGLNGAVSSPRAVGLGGAWRVGQAQEMNLSQLSAAMSQSHAAGKAARAEPGPAGTDARMADAAFEAYAEAAGRSGAPLRPGQPNPAEAHWMALDYATVWSAVFSGTQEDRSFLLEWITARSEEQPGLLADYRRDLQQALANACS